MTGEGHIQVNINTAQFASGKGGSIPACVGQPRGDRVCISTIEVYPHVCGAARRTARWSGSEMGLSPRVRGSRQIAALPSLNERSIPTCAGQPFRHGLGAGSSPGLSPRVRGSQLRETLRDGV